LILVASAPSTGIRPGTTGRREMAMAFVGTHEHSLDVKGRLVLPAKFRSRFSGDAYLTMYAGCIALWTPEGFDAMAARLKEQVRNREVEAQAYRALAPSSELVRPDAQGRVMISERLREYASLEREVVVCGALDRIEIWNPTSWASVVPGLTRALSDAFIDGGGI
jgi:MraZ protein